MVAICLFVCLSLFLSPSMCMCVCLVYACACALYLYLYHTIQFIGGVCQCIHELYCSIVYAILDLGLRTRLCLCMCVYLCVLSYFLVFCCTNSVRARHTIRNCNMYVLDRCMRMCTIKL